MDQLEKAITTKNEWKYINEWRSESSPLGWSSSYCLRREKSRYEKKKGLVWTHWTIEILSTLSMHSWLLTVAPPHLTFFYWFSSPSHSNVRIPFCLPHFAIVASFKKNRAREKLSRLWAEFACEAVDLALFSRIIFFGLKQTLNPKGIYNPKGICSINI